jgi:Fe-S cluster biosynthesis and repair protein YggX
VKQQTMLINHYGLNVMDPQARSFLTKNMEAFLFKSGHEEDVDTSKKGTITW